MLAEDACSALSPVHVPVAFVVSSLNSMASSSFPDDLLPAVRFVSLHDGEHSQLVAQGFLGKKKVFTSHT